MKRKKEQLDVNPIERIFKCYGYNTERGFKLKEVVNNLNSSCRWGTPYSPECRLALMDSIMFLSERKNKQLQSFANKIATFMVRENGIPREKAHTSRFLELISQTADVIENIDKKGY